MPLTSVVTLTQESLMVLLYVAGPILGVSVAVGLVISILQATTSIQEQTLTFVPKVVAIFSVLFLFGGWMLSLLIDFTLNLFSQIPNIARL